MAKKIWTADEVLILIENFDPKNLDHLSKLLNKSKSAIAQKRKYILQCLKLNKNTKVGLRASIQGKRPDLGDNFFRSSWEANVARWLNYQNIQWEFEPKTFYFNKYKRGARSYTPDFYLPKTKEWIEVKGYLNTEGKTKLKRFKENYPNQFKNLYTICSDNSISFFKSLNVNKILLYDQISADMFGVIKTWE